MRRYGWALSQVERLALVGQLASSFLQAGAWGMLLGAMFRWRNQPVPSPTESGPPPPGDPPETAIRAAKPGA